MQQTYKKARLFNYTPYQYALKADHKELSKILEPNVQFEVPIYQRTYDWGRKHCKQLFDDIVKIGKAEGQFHFIGAATYVGEIHMPGTDVAHYQIIDGQQRLTTLLLLLRALRESLNGTSTVTEQKINQLLFNVNEEKDGMEYYKLVLNDDDGVTLKDIMRDGRSEHSNNITANFNFLTLKLRGDDINPDIIWNGIRHLTMVQILIDKDDNPQEIFESMNSTGLNLSETDMIQNYLLMSENQDWQKRVYKNYWLPMEKRFTQNDDFEDFVRNYLAMHKGKIVSKKEMYEYFKKHMNNRDKEEEIKKMHKYSEYYANLIQLKPHSSDKINTVIKYIHSQDTNVANSLLLKLLIDYADNVITEEVCERAFILAENYLLRCHVCDMIKGGNKVFPELIPKINKNSYVKSIEEILMSKSGNRKFPRDIMFSENLERTSLYLNRTMCKYMLVRLEHERDSEKIDPDTLTIEHIMPQKLTNEWKHDLGNDWRDVHEKYLHTIGNLTLTAQDHNSGVGNEPFSRKLDMYKDSNVSLNRDLTSFQSWTENDIKKRTKILVNQAVKLWKCPVGYDSEELGVDNNYDEEEYEEEYLEGKEIIDLWDMLKEKIQLSCDGAKFRMTKVYGSFRIFTESKSNGLCSLEARKNKITLTYNTKLQDKFISPSKFVRDISNIGHYGVGDMSSTIMSEDDIDKAVKLVKRVYDHKIKLFKNS